MPTSRSSGTSGQILITSQLSKPDLDRMAVTLEQARSTSLDKVTPDEPSVHGCCYPHGPTSRLRLHSHHIMLKNNIFIIYLLFIIWTAATETRLSAPKTDDAGMTSPHRHLGPNPCRTDRPPARQPREQGEQGNKTGRIKGGVVGIGGPDGLIATGRRADSAPQSGGLMLSTHRTQ